MHSEFNPNPDEPAHLLQIWIQPDEKGVPPRYEERSLAAAAAGKWHLVTSKTGRDGSIAIHQDADLWLAKLEPGQKVAHELAAGRHAWLHVAEGKVAVNGQELAAGDAAALDGRSAVEVKALERSQVLLFDLN
jgi:redox-sensitive bicupin YhaK (pirin superfamily)